jgi:protein-S-isoprenylcysteine O-methyltransferase Ste14
MKFSSGTEFRLATPNYSRIWSPLFSVGFALILIFQLVYPKSPDWLSGIGFLLVTAGLVVSLVGAVAERREYQAKHPAERV